MINWLNVAKYVAILLVLGLAVGLIYDWGHRNGENEIQVKFDAYKIQSQQDQVKAVSDALSKAKVQSDKDIAQSLADQKAALDLQKEKEVNAQKIKDSLAKHPELTQPNCDVPDDILKNFQDRLK